MTTITLGGSPVETVGTLPEVGTIAPSFELVGSDLEPVTSSQFEGKRVVLNIFPSVDTGVCATSVRQFNEIASSLENTVVICVSKDLPFALDRFCGAEGLDNVIPASAFRSTFGDDYGVLQATGPLNGLLSRAVVILAPNGEVIYTEQVPEIKQEPDYDGVLVALS